VNSAQELERLLDQAMAARAHHLAVRHHDAIEVPGEDAVERAARGRAIPDAEADQAVRPEMAGVSVRTPRSVTSAGTRPFGLSARYSAARCPLRAKSTRTVSYAAPACSSAGCDASAQVYGA
jgi:hypothetical protein